jgi:hypothetical protein
MNGRPQFRLLTGVICIIAAAAFFIRPAQAARAYLPTVGSPPLRFQAVTTNYFVFNPKLFQPATNLVATVSNVVNQATATNDVAVAPPPATNETLTASSQPAAPDYNQNYAPGPFRRFNFNFSTASASDLLTVTPQMITPYLKPDANVTNALDHPGAVVFVPAEMQFMPPPTTVTTESHPGESRATYRSP